MTPYRRAGVVALSAGALLVLGCESILVDRPTLGLIFGTIETVDGAPVAGAMLTGYGSPIAAGCDPTDRLLNETTSGANGAYRLGIAELAPADSECVLVHVHAPGGLRDTVVGPVRIRMRRPLQDSIALDITLSP